MAYSKITLSLNILTIALLFQVTIGVNPVLHFCSSSKNFTSTSPFKRNLNRLLNDLAVKTPPSGFSLSPVGQTNGRSALFGLANCRGDINKEECAACVADAATDIRQLCPNNREGLIWFDTCFLKYSDFHFFGQIDVNHDLLLPSVGNSSESFFHSVTTLLSKLSQEASLAPKLFAAGETNLESSGKLFGLVECTRDLSSVDCKNCIDATIAVLPEANVGSGGRILGGSCNIRYELFPFFNHP